MAINVHISIVIQTTDKQKAQSGDNLVHSTASFNVNTVVIKHFEEKNKC